MNHPISIQRKTDWFFGGKFWFFLDFLVAGFSILIAYTLNPDLRLSWQSEFPGQPSAYEAAIGYGILFALAADILGLHYPYRQRRVVSFGLRIFVAATTAFLIALLLLYFLALQQLGRMVLLQSLTLTIVLAVGYRVLLFRIQNLTKRHLLLLLDAESKNRLRDRIEASGLPFRVADLPSSYDPDISRKKLLDTCVSLKIDEIVVPKESSENADEIPVWMACLEAGLQVTHSGVFVERYFQQVDCSDVGANWFLELDLRLMHPIYHRWKRLCDLVFAVLGLLIAIPLLLPFLLLIWIESGRPLFFRQERVGLRGQKFTIWKLRTMTTAREEDAIEGDHLDESRITKVGRFLRRTRLDEMPQFWNIIRGEMSFIGPRPDWVEVSKKQVGRVPFYAYRTLVKPGLTGWAQVHYGYAETDREVLEKLGYDFYYVKHASLMLDLQILLQTIGAIMKGSR